MIRSLRAWSTRRWLAALGATVVSALVLGLPTDLVPNPVFARRIVAPAWTYPSLAVTAILAGLLLATYVREPDRAAPGPGAGAATDDGATSRSTTAGGLLSFLAIGCPTCNKLVLLALGSSGAITWFEPIQPLLAVTGIVLVAWALRRRLLTADACALPSARAPVRAGGSGSAD